MLSKLILVQMGGLLALLFFLRFASATEMTEYHLASCGRATCVRLDSSKAWQSGLTSSFAFATAKLTLVNKASGKVIETITAKDVYYDTVIEKILIHEPLSGPRGEAYYDFKTEKLIRLR